MRVLSSLLLLVLAVPAVAQEREIRSANLPPELEWELIRMYDGRSPDYDGGATIEREEVVRRDIAAMGGPLRVDGRVEGDIAVVDGDVVLGPDGVVTGSITVVGGEVQLSEDAEVAGTITAYALSDRPYRARDRDGDEEDDRWDRWDRRRWDRGYSRLAVRIGSSYNRVEGLPILFGPVIQTAGDYPLRLEALGIWRSEAGASFDTDRMGYTVSAEQYLHPRRSYSVGGTVFSVVEPMDRWQISDLEASLATAVFHDDYRDHFDRTGWSLFARAEPIRGLEGRIEYRNEDFEALAAGDPWSLFDGGDLWRPQPLVAEGDLQTLVGSLELDLRDDEDDPARGWYGRLAVEQPLSGTLSRPTLLAVGTYGGADGTVPAVLPAADVPTDFTTGLIDLRRYTLVGYDAQLNMRVIAGGSLTGEPLPSQFQHTLGGLGTLPGYATFHADCGARSAIGSRGTAQYFPTYGCDRFALAQVEYRGGLAVDFGFGDPDDEDDDWIDYVDIDLEPTWVVFMDVGQGWAYDDGRSPDRDTGTLVDAGIGFMLDELGIYAALPLNGDVEQEPRFFIRLGRRF